MDANNNAKGISLPWGVKATEIAPSSLSSISDNKLVTFAIGNQKKSRFQKAREGEMCGSHFCDVMHVHTFTTCTDFSSSYSSG